jgi:pyruvate dehydrogenase E2 component (dihydrolipoamide acetyltransferase)
MSTQFTPIEDASSFRRMAAAMWRSPRDPSIYGSMDVEATAALEFMRRHQDQTGTRLTITHLVARAVALALRDQPEINGKVRFWGRLERRATVDVFVTVATDDNRDLSGARIERADEKSLAEIAAEIADRAGKIRSNKDTSYRKSRSMLKAVPWWLARPATWLSDVLVNELHVDLPAQGMRPWAVGDVACVRPVLRLCATFDHRIIDGAAAGRFAARLTELFGSPERLA